MYLNIRVLCTIILTIHMWLIVHAQKDCPIDSAGLFMLLENSDQLDYTGATDSALLIIQLVLDCASEKMYPAARAYAYLKKADLMLKKYGSVDEVKFLCEQALKIAQKLEDYFIVGLSHHQLSQFFRDKNEFEKAIEQLKIASTYYDENRFPDYKGLVYNDIGHIYSRTGNYDQSFEYFIQAIKIFEKSGFEKEAANTIGNMAIVYYRMGDKSKAIELFKQSAEIREKITDVKGLAAIYGNLSTAYQSISLDSAILYQKKAVQNAEKTGVLNTIAQANMNAAQILAKQNKINEAIRYELKAIDYYTRLGDMLRVANRKLSMVSLSILNGDTLSAEAYLGEVEGKLTHLNNKPLNESFYLTKSNYLKSIQKYDLALRELEQYYAWKDSISSDKNKQYILDLESKYETEKKENEIIRLKSASEITALSLANQHQLLLKKSLESKLQNEQILILNKENEWSTSMINFERSSAKQKEESFMLRQQALENEKVIQSQIIRQQKTIQFALISGAILLALLFWLLFNRFNLKGTLLEKEHLLEIRNHLSRELHDEVGSTLTSINLLSKAGIQASVKGEENKTTHMFGKIEDQSKTIQQTLSDIVWALKPDHQNGKSLTARIREQSATILDLSGIKLQISDNIEKLTGIDEFALKELLLISKEAIHNVVKHSGASNVYIDWKANIAGTNHFIISDDGKWNDQSVQKGSGTGMKNMENRASKIGAGFNRIISDSGTSLHYYISLDFLMFYLVYNQLSASVALFTPNF
ncbi:MAG: tetratricopeptide repeat protein [Saprospiraceae bacterium]|nr:tetratricopeptide repeat protein [Saprospiraceae bacterium]